MRPHMRAYVLAAITRYMLTHASAHACIRPGSHHAFPWSAKHGLGWREPDLSYAILRLLERLGVVWDLKVPSDEQIERAQTSKRLRVNKQ